MKKAPARNSGTRTAASRSKDRAAAGRGKVHPVVIYPIRQPDDYRDLEGLYQMIERLSGEGGRYARPLTVMDRKTCHAMEGNRAFERFREETVARHSDILDAWSVDTCQMWYTGWGRPMSVEVPTMCIG
jgi:hypothetical protein